MTNIDMGDHAVQGPTSCTLVYTVFIGLKTVNYFWLISLDIIRSD